MTAQHPSLSSAPAVVRRRLAGAATAIASVAGLAAIAIAVSAAPAFAASAAPATAPPLNCVAVPSACGYPDATNTGVPAGTVLQAVPAQVSSGPGWSYDTAGGFVQVTGNGANLTGLSFTVNVNITASNVTLNDDQITGSGQSSVGVSLRHTSNVTIENSTISGVDAGANRIMTGIKDIYGDATGTQILNDNISQAETGIQIESGLVQGTYIHNTGFIAGDHVNGITSNGGFTALLTINDNTILIDRTQTDAVGLFEDFGVQSNRVISNNLLAGGDYPIYAGQNTGDAATSNIQVTGNRISTLYYPQGGQFGPVDDYNPAGIGDTWTANMWDSTGLTIPAP
jgi:hypothetical protein